MGANFLTDYGVYAQTIPPLLSRSGSQFEERMEAEIEVGLPAINFAKTAGGRTRRPMNNPDLLFLARSLKPGEVRCLFQTRLIVELEGWAVRGDVDIIRLERDAEGALHLIVADMKSSRASSIEHYLQVAFYHAMLQALFTEGDVPLADIRQAILFRGTEETPTDITPEDLIKQEGQKRNAAELFGVHDALLEFVPDQESYLEAVRDLVTNQDSTANAAIEETFDEIPYHVTYKCDGCIYNEFCMKWTAERDDLSLVPHLTPSDKDILRNNGVDTTRDLAHLKDFRKGGGTGNGGWVDLVPSPNKETLVRRLSVTWPIGPRIDELVHRARYYRRWRKDEIDALTYIPSKGHGTLPYCDADHNPNLVRIYIDAQHDYLQDRLYMLAGLVVACENGKENPDLRRTVVSISSGPPNTAEEEQALFVGWITDVLSAIYEVAAPDANDEKKAPIHLIFFNRYVQRVLLDALGRHFGSVTGATPLYDFVTQIAAFNSPIISFLEEEVRDLKNYPMMCQSLHSISAFLKFNWRAGTNYREIFRFGMFDFWGHLDESVTPEGEQPWYTSKARFKSEIPLEYAYQAWGDLADPPEDKADPYKDFRKSTLELPSALKSAGLEAMEHIARNFKGNHLTTKTPFDLLPCEFHQ